MKNLVLLILSAILLTQCTQKIEVSQWRGPNRDGVYPEKDLLKQWPEDGPELIWKFDDLGIGYSSAVVTDNYVITAGTVDSTTYIFKFDHTGSLIYKKELGPEFMVTYPGINSTPLLYDGLGYILGGLGDLYCFDIESGEIIWQKNLLSEFDGRNITYGITENLIINDDKLFCSPGGIENNVIALNRHNGDLIWSSEGSGGKTCYGSPNIMKFGENKYLLMVIDSTLMSINTNDGNVAWKYNIGFGSSAVPYYRDGYIFMNDVKPNSCVMLKVQTEGNSVSQVWKSDYINYGMGDAVVLGNKIYGASWKHRGVYCLDWNTGELIDSVKIKRMSSVITADGMIYSYEYSGEFELLQHDENGLNKVSSFRIKGGNEREHCSVPVVYNGRLYIRHDNSLFVYDIAAKS